MLRIPVNTLPLLLDQAALQHVMFALVPLVSQHEWLQLMPCCYLHGQV
jgi:hypothetical protein